MRFIIEGRGAGQQIVKNGHRCGVVFIGAAAEHGVLHAELDGLIAVAYGLTARGAGRSRRYDAAGNAEHLRDIDGRCVHH